MRRINSTVSFTRDNVAPFAGAWIESHISKTVRIPYLVAPFAGAWIDTTKKHLISGAFFIAFLHDAWIESNIADYESEKVDHTLAGAWIERC